MVELAIRNTRMKDFYDIWFMATTWDFELETLHKAIETSFQRRGIAVPRTLPFALTEDFANDTQKQQQWGAFINRLNPGDRAPSLEEVGALLRVFLTPCFADKPENSRLHWGTTRQWEDQPA